MESSGVIKAIPRFLVAVLKHLVEQGMGEEAVSIFASQVAVPGHGDLNSFLDDLLDSPVIHARLQTAAEKAALCFQERCDDQTLLRWNRGLPLWTLPGLHQALVNLPDQLDQREVESLIRRTIIRDWRELRPEQIEKAVTLHLDCLMQALLPVKDLTLNVIGKVLYETRDEVRDIKSIVTEILRLLSGASLPAWRALVEVPPRPEHFTGREAELKKVLSLLQPGRVVALVGPGGIGKTAIAAEAIWRLVPESRPPELFPDGVLYHSFYNRPQVDLAFEHIVQSFGEEPKPSLREAARRALAGRKALVFLDGTENAGDLNALLDVCGACGVLLTSRSRRDARSIRLDIRPLPLEKAVRLL